MNVKIEYKLNEIMSQRNISFRQLEIISGVSYSHINAIANGKKDATLTVLCKIAIALGLKPENLYEYNQI